VGLGSGRALLGSRADGFHLSFGGGRVSYRLDGLAQPVSDAGDPVSLDTQCAEQFRARQLRNRHGAVGVGRAGGAGLSDG
jgi:hypothetical protein